MTPEDFAHIAHGRALERADVLRELDAMLAGVPGLRAKFQAAGRGGAEDFALFGTRLRMLRELIAAGLHERAGGGDV